MIKRFVSLAMLSALAVVAALQHPVAAGDPVEGLLRKARKQLAKSRYASVLEMTSRALREDPDHPEAKFLEGSALLREGDAMAACDRLRDALTLHPSLVLGALDSNRGPLEAALRGFEQTLARSPDDAPSLRARAQVLTLLGRTAEAVEACEAWRDLDPQEDEALECLLESLTRNGAVDRAVAVLREVRETHDETFVATLALVTARTVAPQHGAASCRLAEKAMELISGDTVEPAHEAAWAPNDTELLRRYLESQPAEVERELVFRLRACYELLESADEGCTAPGSFEEELDVTFPSPIRQVHVIYPELTRVARLDGGVVLRAAVLEDGTVGGIEVLHVSRAGLGFEEAATTAARQWQYVPATLDGEPVAVHTTFLIPFDSTR